MRIGSIVCDYNTKGRPKATKDDLAYVTSMRSENQTDVGMTCCRT